MPPSNPSGGPRMSRGIKLVLMGVAGAALLYSCAPAVGGMPIFWFLPWFLRGPSVTAPATPGHTAATGQTAAPGQATTPGQTVTTTRQSPSHATPAPTQSQRGGFGSTGSSGGSSGSS